MLFDALGRHALGELIEVTPTVTYGGVSRPTGDFKATTFKARQDYIQPDEVTDMPKFAVISSNYTATTVANGASGDLVLDTELVDGDSIVSLSSNQATVANTSWYDIILVVDFYVNGGSAVSADGYIHVYIQHNGASDWVNAYIPLSSGNIVNFDDFTFSFTFQLNAGQHFTVAVGNETGHSLDAYVISATITQKT